MRTGCELTSAAWTRQTIGIMMFGGGNGSLLDGMWDDSCTTLVSLILRCDYCNKGQG